MESNFFFVWKPGGAREPAGPRMSQDEPGGLFLAMSSCFPLVSDGPMVRDVCNSTKRKVTKGKQPKLAKNGPPGSSWGLLAPWLLLASKQKGNSHIEGPGEARIAQNRPSWPPWPPGSSWVPVKRTQENPGLDCLWSGLESLFKTTKTTLC